jgi:prepilin-type processing-associated H-X9-DG protein
VFLCPSEPADNINTDRPFTNPVSITLARSNYPGNGGDEDKTGLFDTTGAKLAIKDIPDGTSNTLAAGERVSTYDGTIANFAAIWGGMSTEADIVNQWALWGETQYKMPTGDFDAMTNGMFPNRAFSSRHTNGANFALCDGAVRFIAYSISWTDTGAGQIHATDPTSGTFNRLGHRRDGQPIPSDF